MMRLEEFPDGTRIYYGGDMANDAGAGTVVGVQDGHHYGQVVISMDDGRRIIVSPTMFDRVYLGHGGTRFVLEAEYLRWRAERIAEMASAVAEMRAR